MGKPPHDASVARAVRDDGRRERVLDEAARLLNEVGVTGDLLEQLAANLGLTRAALYGYVEDRPDLVFRCYLRACEIMEQRLDAATETGRDPLEVLDHFVRSVLDPALPPITALSEIGYLREEDARIVLGRVGIVEGKIARILALGARVGQMRDLDRLVAARALLSLVYWLKLGPRWLSEEASLPGDRLLRAASQMMLNGLAAAPIPAPSELDLSRLTPRMTEAFDRSSLTAARRDAILAAASRLFNERGLETTSIDDIAQAVGVSKRTVLNHFKDKLTLISEAQLRGYRIFRGIADLAHAAGPTAAQAMAAGIHASVMASLYPAIAPLRVFSGLPGLDAKQRQTATAASLNLQNAYELLFAQGLEDGSLRPVDNRATMLALAGASAWVARGAVGHVAAEGAAMAASLTDLLMNGLRVR
ncbi:TetR/AcrR family transcriptional regulator [Phenylobacterium sp.]|uniref:TetR/AcrR family transcriptional regulator n=1 Tax=Phenylobacterium sp. TaxID=1871053 RepID=UPI0028A0E353|nr:TetR/AcrR family transcriptional regulator [Phenylobacterium sp.]